MGDNMSIITFAFFVCVVYLLGAISKDINDYFDKHGGL